MSRLSHRTYYQHWDVAIPHDLVRVYCCPCCDFPTVGEPPSYEICPLCNWEDDDADDRGGPNGGYSLEEARLNFKQHLTMYNIDAECGPQLQQHGYKLVRDWELRPDKLEYKKGLMSALKEYMAEPDLRRRGEIWEKVRQLDKP